MRARNDTTIARRSVCLIERPYLLRQLASGIRRDSLSSIRKYVRRSQLRHRTELSTNLLSIFPSFSYLFSLISPISPLRLIRSISTSRL